MADRVRSVVRQTKARIFGGLTKLPDKIVSLCEPHTRVPRLVAADAGYYSRANEEAVKERGVDYMSIPNRSTRSEERRKLQKRR